MGDWKETQSGQVTPTDQREILDHNDTDVQDIMYMKGERRRKQAYLK